MITAYKNRKVFITGLSGFKGSWLAIYLLHLGADVCGYSLRPNTSPSLFEILKLDKKLKHIYADVRDYTQLEKEITSFGPDIIFHLAARPLVLDSYLSPLETLETNIMGTVNLLEVAKKYQKTKGIIIVTSDKCYQKRGPKDLMTLYKESDPLGAKDPYSTSKACQELITASYRKSFFNQESFGKTHSTLIASARAGNTLGGGDYTPSRLIPDFIRSLEDKKTLRIRSPQSIRPWQFVIELIYAYLLLGSRLLEGDLICAQSFNFGPHLKSCVSVEELLGLFIHEAKCKNFKHSFDSFSKEEFALRLDTSKAKEILKFTPLYSLEDCVNQTFSWYKKFQEKAIRDDIGNDMYKFSLGQIESYEQVLKKNGCGKRI